MVQRDGEAQDEATSDRAWDKKHGELVAREQVEQEGGTHRRDGQSNAQDPRDEATLADRHLVR